MYETYCEYRNARTVHYNRWSTHTQVDGLVQELVAGIESRKKSDYTLNMKVLVLDLFHSYLTDPTQFISYYRDKNHYDFKKRFRDGDRYVDNPLISYDYFVGSADKLIAGKYIINKAGQKFYNELEGVHGFLPKMRATPKLVELWRKYGWTADMIGQWKPDSDVEVIILKAKTIKKQIERTIYEKVDGVVIKRVVKSTVKIKKRLKYGDTTVTKRMRRIVLAYNQLLDRTHIDCDAACIADIDRAALIEKLEGYGDSKEPVIRLRLANKHVNRVFNEGDRTFTLGGRYYGAWWIGCPGELRKYITLNNNPTVELDYSGIHIHLLYALEEINYAALRQDPYSLDDGIPDRAFNKLILLTAINAENETKARDSVFDQMRKDKLLKKYNLTDKTPITNKLKLLKEKHLRIAKYIASGKGLMLQYYDSCIIEKLIQYAIRLNMPILTVHDSVICEAKKATLIRDKMWQYFTDLLSEKLDYRIKYTSVSPHAKDVFKHLVETQRRYQLPQFKLPGLMRPSRAAVTSWLTPDALINIKRDVRTNVCTGDCNHQKRLLLLSARRRRFLTSVVVRLVAGKGERALVIKD